jgi:purine-binding chemotaxis protein CheW
VSAPTVATSVPDRLTGLRQAFDASYALAPPVQVEPPIDLLAIQVAGTAYAIRLSSTVGLYADRAVTPLPGPLAELLGVASFRGLIVAVYDLGTLLGHPASPAPRWLVLDTGTPPVALAFDSVDGHLRVPVDAIADAPAERTEVSPAREVVSVAEGFRPLVDLPAIRTAIQNRSSTTERRKR